MDIRQIDIEAVAEAIEADAGQKLPDLRQALLEAKLIARGEISEPIRLIVEPPSSTNIMAHKGYTARIEFDGRNNIFVGRVLGVRTMISFHGETVSELRVNLEAAIDDYLEDCAAQGLSPEKPASGNIMLRVPPEVHGAALVAAQSAGKSLNQWAIEVLRNAAHA